jgi:hypothetical protein
MESDEEEFRYVYTVPGSAFFPLSEPAGMPHKQFLSYLEYRACELEAIFPNDVTFIRNTRNGTVVSVPTRHYTIQRELIYEICLELGVNMPDEFQQFQRMMSTKQPGSTL